MKESIRANVQKIRRKVKNLHKSSNFFSQCHPTLSINEKQALSDAALVSSPYAVCTWGGNYSSIDEREDIQ